MQAVRRMPDAGEAQAVSAPASKVFLMMCMTVMSISMILVQRCYLYFHGLNKVAILRIYIVYVFYF